jgi:hypothetical protein
MKVISRRQFSLLEVLIALMLITASLPLSLTPFIYATTDQIETVQKLRKEKSVLYYLVTILGELHTGAIPLNQLDGEQEYPFKGEWKADDWKDLPITGSYKFKKMRDKPISEGQTLELWQTTIEIKEGVGKNASSSNFTYEFVVRKGKAEQETPKKEEGEDET